jgi:hypothetical protein
VQYNFGSFILGLPTTQPCSKPPQKRLNGTASGQLPSVPLPEPSICTWNSKSVWQPLKASKQPITFQSGFTANLATIPALVSKEDVIFSDELNHASIIDGSRLSGARIVRFAHANPSALEMAIKENAGTYRRGLVVSYPH